MAILIDYLNRMNWSGLMEGQADIPALNYAIWWDIDAVLGLWDALKGMVHQKT